MLILKIISRLLDYPTADLQQAKAVLVEAIQKNNDLSEKTKTGLLSLTKAVTEDDIYDVQSAYDALFEKGRSVSLLLFEHVHGESRDRGQAMVDLMQVYQSHGYGLTVKELPDYLPLFLEFLSEQNKDFTREYLQDVAHILALLQARLEKRQSPYHYLFAALIELSGVEISEKAVLAQVDTETPDDTLEAIDAAWEDKEVRFDDPLGSQQGACPSPQAQVSSEVSVSVDSVKIRQPQPLLNGE